ncbi:hypothetical protein HGRIS_001271 [Hohenbuehelia grisea]|uniref:Uncharacterized protein n=1 Tax=Hohenbuehelia grisea TaxID=104357 RepID=A0ABR3JQ41_9AGAR
MYPTAPSTEELDSVVGAWSTIAYNCHKIDISSGLSQQLAKAQHSSSRLVFPMITDPPLLKSPQRGQRSLQFKRRTSVSDLYQALPGNADQSLLSNTDGGAWLWAGASEANYCTISINSSVTRHTGF